ncbi:MAG: XdhC family protein [Thermoplasmata archaeon]|nr:XdhC family protein [Thermoplasmata archaeon]
MYEFYEKLAELIKKHSRLALATVLHTTGSTPREVGAKMVIFPDGNIYGTIGGGKLELLVMEDAKQAIKSEGSTIKKYTLLEEYLGGIGSSCGGEASVFIEVITRGERLMILGGGHIGLALYKMAIESGFSVVVVDERSEFVSPERFSGAEVLLNCSVDDPKVKELVDKDTYIVIVTHEHKQDKLAVKSLIDLNFKYMGMIGSKRKVKQVITELLSEAISSQKLKKVYTPIGLDINAETPAEIAVSILAELIQVRKTGAPSKISMVNRKEVGDAEE